MSKQVTLTAFQQQALNAYEKAIAEGKAPVGSSSSEIARRGSAVQAAIRTLMDADKDTSYAAARRRVRTTIKKVGATEMVSEETAPDLYEESALEQTKRSCAAQTRKSSCS